ncbi:DYW family of nucleic acid deaminases-domain-containing protein [Aspergillus carlsbadensis]|nr:DYW family of nucleic acid deaminases-domain-containing protein [Aspergillus carlsbadensis]
MDTPPAADVLYWNAKDYHILCPHCEDVHRHSVNWKAPRTRSPHCGAAKDYTCCFPFTSTGQVAYEIDKTGARYVNICAADWGVDLDTGRGDEGAETETDVDILARDFARRAVIAGSADPSIDNDPREMVDVKLELDDGEEVVQCRRIDSAIEHCLKGALFPVIRYLETSKEATIFLHGLDADGNTMLIRAARGESADMVALLLERGANVNAVNGTGTSALMEAAFWGRHEIAKILLQHGAVKELRDDQNRRAVDLAQPTLKNRRERYRRAGGDLSVSSNRRPGYVEDTFKRDLDRRNIVRLLLGREDRVSRIVYGEPPTLSQEHYRFRLSATGASRELSGPIEVSGPIESYPVADTRKTVARLERGGRFAPIGAMSGWSHNPIESLRVDNRLWTDEVRYISEAVGHTLPPHGFDRAWDGQYYACHAEKQLIAYFVDRHVFLHRDRVPDEALEDQIDDLQARRESLLSNTAAGRELASMRQDRARLNEELIATEDADNSKELEAELRAVENRLAELKSQAGMLDILALEKHLAQLNRKWARHQELMDMANAPQRPSLKAAVIFISSGICDDCVAFRDRVNEVFGLSIQLYEAR